MFPRTINVALAHGPSGSTSISRDAALKAMVDQTTLDELDDMKKHLGKRSYETLDVDRLLTFATFF